MPNHYVAVPDGVRWAQRNIPHYAQWLRFRSFWFAADGLFENLRIDPQWPHQDRSISARNDSVREVWLKNYQSKLADRPDLLDKLVPDYPVFGKRIVMDIDWLKTLCRDNVSVETAGIERVEGSSVLLADGQRIDVDVIICATGFETRDMVGDMAIVGRDGRNIMSCPYRLVDYWWMTRAPGRRTIRWTGRTPNSGRSPATPRRKPCDRPARLTVGRGTPDRTLP